MSEADAQNAAKLAALSELEAQHKVGGCVGSLKQKASVGRMVHYRGPGGPSTPLPSGAHFAPTTYPATVLEAYPDETCDLFVMTRVGHMTLTGIPFASEPTAGHWSWPPRV